MLLYFLMGEGEGKEYLLVHDMEQHGTATPGIHRLEAYGWCTTVLDTHLHKV